MSPYSKKHIRSLSLLVTLFCVSGLAGAESYNNYLSKNADFIEFHRVSDETCPYSPGAPAENGGDAEHPQAFEPRPNAPQPFRGAIQPAIYVEWLAPADDAAKPKIVI